MADSPQTDDRDPLEHLLAVSRLGHCSRIRLEQAAMGQPETQVGQLCKELQVTWTTLYRYVGPGGELRSHGKQVLAAK